MRCPPLQFSGELQYEDDRDWELILIRSIFLGRFYFWPVALYTSTLHRRFVVRAPRSRTSASPYSFGSVPFALGRFRMLPGHFHRGS